MVRLGPRLCATLLLVAAASVAGAARFSSAQDRSGVRNIAEELAIHHGNRMKMVHFDDDHSAACPLLTTLFYAAGEKVDILFPHFALAGSGIFMSDGATVSHQANAQDFVFFKEHCRYIVTIKKFVVRPDAEVDVPLYSPDHSWLKEPLSRQPTRPVTPDGPIRSEGNKVVIDDDPGKSGFTQLRATFDHPDSTTKFAGLLYFAPKNMTVFLVNVPKELRLEFRRNHAIKSYEIDIASPASRVRLSVAKEIYRNDSWTKVFGQ